VAEAGERAETTEVLGSGGRVGNPMYNAEFAEISVAMAQAYARAELPMTMHLDVTYRCDLDCQHCYLDDKAWPELNPQELRSLIEQLHAAGTLFLVWSGGEVFQRPDFLEQLEYAASLGFVNRIKTHGGNLTPERVEVLARSRIGRVDVSLYALDPQVHDRVTRRPGSWQRTVEGLQRLREAGVPARVNVVVMPETVEEIPALWQFLESLGVDFHFYTHVFRDHSGGTALDALDLGPEARLRAETLLRDLQPRSPRPLPIQSHAENIPCKAGRLSGYISPDGAVWPCVSWPMALGHVREKPFAEIWSGSELRQQIVQWTNEQRTGCMSCAGSGFCAYCPGESFKTTGDWRQAPATFHAATRARMLAFEAVRGETFTGDEWASVPVGGRPAGEPGRGVFSIYRPRKSQGARVVPGSR
jgi:MoaA/NifB/PqqE/SkfB family radical SAM enzyme